MAGGSTAKAWATLALPCSLLITAAGLAPHDANDPTVISVPYLDSIEITINPAWELVVCPTLNSEYLRLVCDEGVIELEATSFEPQAEPLRLPVDVRDSQGRSRTLNYTVRLAPPEAASLTTQGIKWPGIAGGRTLIPLTALVTSCDYCTSGASFDVSVVTDEDAPLVQAWTTEHHVVVEAPASITRVTLAVRVQDSAGTWSDESEISLTLQQPQDSRDAPLHLVVPMSATVSPREMLAVTDPEQWQLESCTPALLGTLQCDDAGIRYDALESPAQGDSFVSLARQTTVIWRSSTGDTIASSVTFVPDAQLASGPHLAPAAPMPGLVHLIAFPVPPQHGDNSDHSNAGVLAPLWQILPSTI